MTDSFAHLHVASCFSLRYGTCSPADLVERAAQARQSALALTDRDGLYGAVRFVRAAQKANIAPVVGVDLACVHAADSVRGERERSGFAARPGSARARMFVDARLPRVTILARGAGAGISPGRGWASLCRLVTATHLSGQRGRPVATPALIAAHAFSAHGGSAQDVQAQPPKLSDQRREQLSGLLVLLGPDSDVGRAVAAGRRDEATARLSAWRALLPSGALIVEIVDHAGPPGSAVSTVAARRMWALAQEAQVPAVLTAAVRHGDPAGARVADVLDAARRLVALDERHLDRVSTAGYLASSEQMAKVALRVAGEDHQKLLRASGQIARECALHPRADLGIGQVHLPETSILGLDPQCDAQQVLSQRCFGAINAKYPYAQARERTRIQARLEAELQVIATLGYPTYFLTVAAVCDLIRALGVRVAARGSGAGSLVNHLLGVSGVDPIRHELLMERFCTPLRAQLPDVDIDVESARRPEVYRAILERFGGERVTCVSMMETYRVRHAIRDVGAALGMPPSEIDTIAKAFPHIKARDARSAMEQLPELSAVRATAGLEMMFDLVESLDGLPRHVALHPCGVILCNTSLLDRTPIEASSMGFPMSQFDKDDVEDMGLLKLDVLGIRMQSAMAHAVAEVARVSGETIDLDDRAQVDLEDEATFDLIRSTHTLGCFQIESPGQRELIGKFAPETFEDIIIDISLFRPGPVKSDMITPFLRARQGWAQPEIIHPTLTQVLASTAGVVVFHEQVLRLVSITTGASLAQADEVRRALGTSDGRDRVEQWWRQRAQKRGYTSADIERIWEVLASFGSFGFCKAHAAAFALPTVQSAWLKAHHPAAFYAGVLTHDPGMYPKRLILADARRFGVGIAGLDVNASNTDYRVEPAGEYGTLRLSLLDVSGMSQAEAARIVAGQPYRTLEDLWRRAQPSRPVAERLILAGGFDALYGIGDAVEPGLGRRGRITRRDLLLHLTELDRWSRGHSPGANRSNRRRAIPPTPLPANPAQMRAPRERSQWSARTVDPAGYQKAGASVSAAAQQSRGCIDVVAPDQLPAQLTLDLGDAPALRAGAGLPEMSRSERVRAELDILGLDVSEHVLDPFDDLLEELAVVRSADLRQIRARSEILVAGTKVATQTPPVRSGRRVVFVTLDDPTGPVDATFLEDAQVSYASTVFNSWMLLIRGVVRRTGPRGVSVRATGAWELGQLRSLWRTQGSQAVHSLISSSDSPLTRRADSDHERTPTPHTRPVLVHPSGFRQSPFADVRPPGEDVGVLARKLWHSSPGSSGR